MSLMREAANQSTGRLPAVVQRASIQQSAPDPGLVPPHTVQWGHCSLKTGLKTARGMVGFWVFFFFAFYHNLQAHIAHTKSGKAKLSNACDSKDTAVLSLLQIKIK